MVRAPQYTVILIALVSAAAQAQDYNNLTNFQGASWEGVHFYGLSAFTSYVSSAYPIQMTAVVPIAANQLQSDINYGVSGSAGWHHRFGENASASVQYSGTYNHSTKYSSLTALSHTLDISASWALTQKWTVNFSADGAYRTIADYLFAPTGLGTIAQLPASATDLAAAMAVGQFSNSQVAAALTGSMYSGSAVTPAGNPATALLVGTRVLTYGTRAAVTYQPTQRLSFGFSGVSAGGQNTLGDTSGVPQQNYVMPRTLGLTGGADMNFSLTPRTNVGMDVNVSRMTNQFQHAYTTTADGSIGRMMGMNWFLRGAAGVAISSSTSIGGQAAATPIGRQVIGSASIGYRLSTQTFVATYNRSSMELNGFAIGTNSRFAGAWGWRRPGASWSLNASATHQELGNTGFTTLSGWQATAGWGIRLPEHLTLMAQYVYARSTGTYLGNTSSVSVNSVRLTIGWVPAQLTEAFDAAMAAARQ